ncbi:MAG: selenocysteine-specific translation elongation factor [Chloroflexi bacterium]|nr:MAG: selenocysteine-specific translation elongation factor [Chloroflexota bacterium]
MSSQRSFVVGTAGHVDHGKSSLVRALTGIDPDRLAEEREREMTIDLGFAWLELPSGPTISIVDVPGHERFIKNMLAGVGGIDAAVLVVAADEGPMPQTAEHLAILDLLEISHGVVALTKADLVDDEWLELVSEETRERLKGTTLADAPLVPVSSTTGAGLDILISEVTTVLSALPQRSVDGKPRLPVDRAFSVTGFGTVVTGTLLGGPLDVGQEVEILPGRRKARVRGLQSHGRKVERAMPGIRTAVNLSGIDREELQRGDVVTRPGWLQPTTLLDVRLRVVADTPRPLEQNDPVDLFIGASEAPGFVTLLDADRLMPGEEGWVQVRLGSPVVALSGDRYIVRQPSPSLTIGGGVVVDPHPRRHRRFRSDVIAALETRASGTPEERLIQALAGGPREVRDLASTLDVSLDNLQTLIIELARKGSLHVLGSGTPDPPAPTRFIVRTDTLERIATEVIALINDFHARYPLRRGMPREELRSRLGYPARAFDGLVATFVASGAIEERGSLLAITTFEIQLSSDQQRATERFLAALEAQPNAPPNPAEFGVEGELLAALEDMGLLVRLPDNIVFGAAQLDAIRRATLETIDKNGSITLAQFRDQFGSSRKYAQAVLEYFDQERTTRRVGDVRVRGNG